MKTSLVAAGIFLSLGLAAHAAWFHSDFDEPSLGAITGLNKDVPGVPTEDFSLNTANDTLDFVTTNADMWGSRANAPIGWVAAPTVANGVTWWVETYVTMESGGSNHQEVGGLTFYGAPDGSNPDFTFALDDWNGWQVTLQGLSDNNPRVNGPISGIATGVYLRVEITEGGATDTYNFYYKENPGDLWTQMGGAANNYASDFANSRVGMCLKSDSSGGGAAQFHFLTVDLPGALTLSDSEVAGITSTSATVQVTINTNADQVAVYWDTTDQGETNTGWMGSSDLGAWTTGAGQVPATLTNLQPDTAYVFRYGATNGALSAEVWSIAGAVATDFGADQAPINLSATAVSYALVDLTWVDTFHTETGFLVQRAEDSGFTTGLVEFNLGPNATGYSDMSVADNTTYHYRVAATNAVGPSDFSTPDSATTPPALSSAQIFHSDFTEASLGAVRGLNKDTPGFPTEEFNLNTANDTLDFVTTSANMWLTRTNAPIAWVAAPTVAAGLTWSVETYISMEKDGANSQEVGGITFYGGPDGAHADLSFGLDDWNGWNVRLQGFGDNNPNVGGADLGSAPGVFLRAEITEGGATDTYNFFYKVNMGDAWTPLGGVASHYPSSFPNTRVALFLKSNNLGGGAQFDYLTVSAPTGPLVLSNAGATGAAANAANVEVTINDNADKVVVYWGTTDPGQTDTGWMGSDDLGAWAGGAGQVPATLTGLQPDTAYVFRYRATNGALSAEAWSVAGAAVSGFDTGQAPSNLTATAMGFTHINLAWNEDFDTETGFLVRRADDGGFNNGVVDIYAGPNATTYSDTTVAESSTYHYKIAALNAARQSDFSVSASATTPAMPTLPADIATNGLLAYYDADSGVMTDGSDVTSWLNLAPGAGLEDQVVQTTPALRPQLNTGVVNGRNSLSFAGDKLVGDDADDFLFGAGDLTWFLVLRDGGVSPDNRRAFGTLLNSAPYSGITASYSGGVMNAMYRFDANLFVPDTSGVPLGTTDFHIIESGRASGDARLYRNGDEVGSATLNNNVSGGPLVLGAERTGGSQYWTGEIAALVIYNRALTADERNETGSTLAGAYGLTTSYVVASGVEVDIATTAGQVEMSWPEGAVSPTAIVQFTLSLLTPAWLDLPVSPTVENGRVKVVVPTDSLPGSYLRVAEPGTP